RRTGGSDGEGPGQNSYGTPGEPRRDRPRGFLPDCIRRLHHRSGDRGQRRDVHVSASPLQQTELDRLLRLDGKVAVVTGAAARIGREIARTFAHQGAQVLVADIDDSTGERTVGEIRERGGVANYTHADVGRADDIRAMIRT